MGIPRLEDALTANIKNDAEELKFLTGVLCLLGVNYPEKFRSNVRLIKISLRNIAMILPRSRPAKVAEAASSKTSDRNLPGGWATVRRANFRRSKAVEFRKEKYESIGKTEERSLLREVQKELAFENRAAHMAGVVSAGARRLTKEIRDMREDMHKVLVEEGQSSPGDKRVCGTLI